MPRNENPDLTNEENVNEGNENENLTDLVNNPQPEINPVPDNQEVDPGVTPDNLDQEIQLPVAVEKEGLLISRLDHPEYITYNGYQKRLSPRHRENVFESLITGELPKGVQILPQGDN